MKAGLNKSGSQRYECQNCGRRYTPAPKTHGYSGAIRQQAIQNYVDEGVQSVHDMHIWGMGTTETALTTHLIMQDATCDDTFLEQVADQLHELFDIEHVTLQREIGDPSHPCRHCESLSLLNKSTA